MSFDVEGLKARVDIVSVVSHYVPLKKRGAEYVGCCVAHTDKNPSMYVSPAKGFVYCFSCGFSADAIDFVMHVEGVDFQEACKRLGAQEWHPTTKIQQETAPAPDRITSKPPSGVAKPDMSIRGTLGNPTRVFEIRDIDGSLIAYEARYDPPGEKKEIRIWSWGARGTAAPSWGMGHLNQPRPLYGLHRLGAKPQAPVLITEGPKKADAGDKLLPTYASMSITGGANAWHKHDFTPLAGKSVLLIPDNDEPGIAAFEKLAAKLADPRGLACKVRLVAPAGQPEGWDIADWTGTTEALIEWAKPRARDYQHIEARKHGIMDEPPPYDLPPVESYTEGSDQRPVVTKREINASPAIGDVYYRVMSQVESKPIRWLWPGRIAKGKVSMIVGNPGLGKSQVCASIASVVSNGGLWPVGREQCQRGTVVILSAEDDPEDTIRPRLEAAGADLDQIYILDAIRVERDDGPAKRGFDLTVDIARLGALLHDIGEPALVIIDPITAYLGDADSHKNAEVRALLAPLSEMASAQGVAVICVSHLTKATGMDALLRVQGSIGFAAAARAVWGVAKDKDNPARRLFMPLKNNLGTDNSGFSYSVEGVRLPESEIDTSHVLWENQLVTQSAEDVFGASDLTHDEQGAIFEAKSFLRDLLREGPLDSKQIEIDARGAGHSMTTLRRAAKEMNLKIAKDGFGRGAPWKWWPAGSE